jgi:hypothetical protein
MISLVRFISEKRQGVWIEFNIKKECNFNRKLHSFFYF